MMGKAPDWVSSSIIVSALQVAKEKREVVEPKKEVVDKEVKIADAKVKYIYTSGNLMPQF